MYKYFFMETIAMIKNLEDKIKTANISYRRGESIMTDSQYDTLMDELEVLDPDNVLLSNVGLGIDDSRKDKLPIKMASMNKVKTVDEIHKWFKSKNIPMDTELVMTPKFDGASLCVDEFSNSAWTRGDGVEGQRSDGHLELISREQIINEKGYYSFGELIMKRDVFTANYSEEFSNPRNLVAGQLNHKTPNVILRDCDYISFGLININNDKLFNQKSEEFDFINKTQKNPIDYKLSKLSDLSSDSLLELFTQWNKEYEIDGIIIEINDYELRSKLGRETSSGNPCYARAFKGDFEEVKITTILNIGYEVSKNGLLKPVAQIEPTILDGAIVRNVTLNNARFVRDFDLGAGSVIKIKRSGMVIPKLVSVISATGFTQPTIEGCVVEWNENGVELITKSVTENQRLKQLISFFEILDVDNMGEGTCKQFFDNGFDTPEKVLLMTKDDMLKLDRFGERKAQKIIDSINKKRNVSLSKLQHAVSSYLNIFNNLGSRKLKLLEHFKTKPSVSDVMKIDGFAEISAKSYVNGYDIFFEYIKTLPMSIMENDNDEKKSSELSGMSFIFTGFRSKESEDIIKEKGGEIKSSVSKNVTHLVCKDKNSTSSKINKARDLGIIIMNVEELNDLLHI